MPHEGSANPVTNDGPRFHSNVPIIELTKRVTRAIEASDVSSTPPVVETMDRVTHETRLTPTKPNGARATRPRLGNPTYRTGRGWDKHGRTPRLVGTRGSTAPGKSTNVLSL